MLDLRSHVTRLYGKEATEVARQVERWELLAKQFHQRFPDSELHMFSSPGRTELGGNHTDHNHGKVLAASISLDSIAIAARNSASVISVHSEGYERPFTVKLDNLSPVESERGSTNALIRGIACSFQQLGYTIGGFDACMTSDVPMGSGLSSSASVEVLIALILDNLYNMGTIPANQLAAVGQYAENRYFGKPCGLMDQLTCAVGGIVAIDFLGPATPKLEQVTTDLPSSNYSLLVVDTGGNHTKLTEDYACIPDEMKSVGALLGKRVCRDVKMDELLGHVKRIRREVGDRAFLRCYHFISENARVDQQVAALKRSDFETFLCLRESGISSFCWLQNAYSTKNPMEQGISLALALTESYLRNIHGGASRVHGGGFAGTIQVFLPNEAVSEYVKLMESVFHPGCGRLLSIRPVGAVYLKQPM